MHPESLQVRAERRQLNGGNRDLRAVAFSPDGKLLAGGSAKGTVHVWDLVTGQECRRFTGHRAAVRAVGFSPDGRRLCSGSDDTTALVWDVTGLCQGRPVPGKPAAGELDALWADLASADGFRALFFRRATDKEWTRVETAGSVKNSGLFKLWMGLVGTG